MKGDVVADEVRERAERRRRGRREITGDKDKQRRGWKECREDGGERDMEMERLTIRRMGVDE